MGGGQFCSLDVTKDHGKIQIPMVSPPLGGSKTLSFRLTVSCLDIRPTC